MVSYSDFPLQRIKPCNANSIKWNCLLWECFWNSEHAVDTQHPECIVGRVYWFKVLIIKEAERSKFLWRPKAGEHTFIHVRGTESPRALMLPCTLTSVPFQPLALFHIQNPHSLIFITLSTWSFQFLH